MMFDRLYTTKMKGNSNVLKERFKRIYFGPKQFSRKVSTRITVLLLLILTGVTVLYAYIDGAEKGFVLFKNEVGRCRKWLQSLDADTTEIIFPDENFMNYTALEDSEKRKIITMLTKVSTGEIRELKKGAIGDGAVYSFVVKTPDREKRIYVSFVKMYDFGINFEDVEVVFDNPELQEYLEKNYKEIFY